MQVVARPAPPGTGSGRSHALRSAVAGAYCGRPVGPVDLDRYALRGRSRVEQLKRCVRAGVGEQPRALADHHGIDEQGDLVDKLVVEEPADQVAAAVVSACRGAPSLVRVVATASMTSIQDRSTRASSASLALSHCADDTTSGRAITASLRTGRLG
jgi:hypothetical protein